MESSSSSSASDRPSHHLPNGNFTNPWPSAGKPHGFWDFFSLFTSGEWDSKRGKPPPEAERVPVVPMDWDSIRNFHTRASSNDNSHSEHNDNKQLKATWLGHATFLVQMENCNILTDPCCSERCSPFQFAGPKRIRPLPFSEFSELPPTDVVIISHNHYDHLDYNTIQTLGPSVTYFVPLGNKAWFNSNFPSFKNVIELDWWGSSTFYKGDSVDSEKRRGLEVVCTPCQHFTGRGLTDRMATLWSSWVVRSLSAKEGGPSFFFGGDTGYRAVPKGFSGDIDELPYCPEFKKIGDKYGPFSLSMIPIGAYSPRWFMSPVHCDPYDAVCIHSDVKSQKSIGMHWGTFILTDEDPREPPQKLKEALRKYNKDPEEFITVNIGESLEV